MFILLQATLLNKKKKHYINLRHSYIKAIVRDGKMYKHARGGGVNFFLAWVKYVPNFTLFCRESELRCNFCASWGNTYGF